MLEPKEQLRRLVAIQDLALAIQSARAVVDEAPARIEEIESRFRERNAEYVAVKERFDILEKDRNDRTLELETLEVARKKFMESLMQVKNQREYAAVLKEIDSVKAHIGAHEEAVLKGMEESEKLKTDLDARSDHIEQERIRVGEEHARVGGEAAAAAERITEAERERARLEADLPQELIESVRRVEESRGGVFLAKAEKALCQACFVRVRPQVFQEIRAASRIHNCGQCRRFLYYEPALGSEPTGPPASDIGQAGVETANGGAV
jgi:predicted  nucleic acid-binding Zn-ribbon protein